MATTFGPIQGLGTLWYFEFYAEPLDTTAATATTKMMRDFEAHYSRFQPHSWLSTLNTLRAFEKPDAEFVALLQQALHYYEKTNGIFNIAVGEKMEAAGYNQLYTLTAEGTAPPLPALPEVLTVTRDRITLSAGRLDLGGIGKGFLIDKIANFFKLELGLKEFLINGGGDIYATHQGGEAVEIQLAHPKDKSQYIATVKLKNHGFAASSPYLRAWKDPVTGKPMNHLHTENQVATFIIAETTTDADVFATTLAVNPEAAHPHNLKKLLVQDTRVLHKDEEFTLVT